MYFTIVVLFLCKNMIFLKTFKSFLSIKLIVRKIEYLSIQFFYVVQQTTVKVKTNTNILKGYNVD